MGAVSLPTVLAIAKNQAQVGIKGIKDEANPLPQYATDAEAAAAVNSANVKTALQGDQAGARTALGLGSAATQPVSAFATPADITAVNLSIANKYTRPGTGIPSTDMTLAVQTSLAKADAALPNSNAENISSSRALLSTDFNSVKYVSNVPFLTINTGMPNGWFVPIIGEVGFVSGAGVTLIDQRVPSVLAPFCTILHSTTANTFVITGTVGGVSRNITAGRALTAADRNIIHYCANTPAMIINQGLPADFCMPLVGACTFVAGSGVTIVDQRSANSATPFCTVDHSPTLNTFYILGSKT